jgi:hypothetical protein
VIENARKATALGRHLCQFWENSLLFSLITGNSPPETGSLQTGSTTTKHLKTQYKIRQKNQSRALLALGRHRVGIGCDNERAFKDVNELIAVMGMSCPSPPGTTSAM